MSKQDQKCARTKFKAERGIALIWVSIIGATLLGCIAIAIDLARLQIMIRHLKNTSDAVSLSASSALDGTKEGWLQAKRRAVALLKEQTIFGAPSAFGSSIRFNDTTLSGAKEDIMEPDQDLRSNVGQYGPLTVTVSRGMYRQDAEGKWIFEDLEGKDPMNIPGGVVPAYSQLPVYMAANAVRVTVSISSLVTTFVNILGVRKFNTTTEESISASEASMAPVMAAPFAIPACTLFLDANPARAWSSGYEFLVDNYKPSAQCERPVFISESDPMSSPDYVDGRIRAMQYVRAPTYNYDSSQGEDACFSAGAPSDAKALNCRKAIPIYAVFGMPSDDAADHLAPATLGEIAHALDRNAGQVPMHFGGFFRPYQGDDIARDPAIQSLKLALARQINSSSQVLDVNEKNYPRLVGYDIDKDRTTRIGPMLYDLWKQSNPPNLGNPINTYRNPLCSSPQVRKYKTVSITVPVVASGNDTPYCNFNEVFHGQPQNTQAPLISNLPTVIGFVKFKLSDFNFDQLNDGSETAFIPGKPSSDIPPDYIKPEIKLLDMNNTQFWKPYVNFFVEHYNYWSCQLIPYCGTPESTGFPNCRDYACGTAPPSDLPITTTEWSAMGKCYNLPSYRNARGCIGDRDLLSCVGLIIEGVADWIFHGGRLSYGETRDHSDPNLRCLPQKNPGCADATNYDCWQVPQARKAQYGCAAALGRLECGQDVLNEEAIEPFFPRGQSSRDRRPVLVANPAP